MYAVANQISIDVCRAKKVMRKRSDIEVTVCHISSFCLRATCRLTVRQTKHNYDIKYKYEWSECIESIFPSRLLTIPDRMRDLLEDVSAPAACMPVTC